MWNSEDICVWLQMTKYTDTHSMVANLQNSPVLYDDIKIRFFSTAVSRTETYDLHMFDCHIFVVQNCWNIFNAWYTYMWVDFTWCFFFLFTEKHSSNIWPLCILLLVSYLFYSRQQVSFLEDSPEYCITNWIAFVDRVIQILGHRHLNLDGGSTENSSIPEL